MRNQGVIVSIDGNKSKVRITTESPECMGCVSKSHCNFSDTKSKEITVINDYGAKISDQVVFESEPSKVLFSAVLIWILPLFAMFIGYLVADRYAKGVWPILSAFVFLFFSFGLLKLVDNIISGGSTFYPKITEIVHCPEKENGGSN